MVCPNGRKQSLKKHSWKEEQKILRGKTRLSSTGARSAGNAVGIPKHHSELSVKEALVTMSTAETGVEESE